MATAKKQKTRPTLSITKGDQIFAENEYSLGQLLEIGGKTDRLPVATQQLAAWCAGPDPGQLGIGFGNFQTVGAFHCFCQLQLEVSPCPRRNGRHCTAQRPRRAISSTRIAAGYEYVLANSNRNSIIVDDLNAKAERTRPASLASGSKGLSQAARG